MSDIFEGMKSKLKTREDYAEWASELEYQVSVVKTEIIIAMYLGLVKMTPEIRVFMDTSTGISEATYESAPRKPEGNPDAPLQ